ncbi:chalcone isomerase family protein [Roseibium aestuarii]|uniref:Chalcone isomerase family protein n=1 Tax=Roseibium aestuarii TaxID=2600299 RepID=A0ABW4JW57_9HYPH|nr:chalcone isomerase family protein [Roseibium aestuarii]
MYSDPIPSLLTGDTASTRPPRTSAEATRRQSVRSLATLALFATLAITLLIQTIGPARAEPAAARLVAGGELVGEGRFTFFGLPVFDASLYAPQGRYAPDGPFALALTYRRDFKGTAIAEKSIDEIRKQGRASEASLASWQEQMSGIFPNVKAGQSLIGVKTAQGSAVFYSGSRKIGEIRDPAFARAFFDIWLGSSTSNRSLRNKLVGQAS